MSKNEKLNLAYRFVKHTNTNIFLTGKAGTGKTTFLRALQDKLPKRMVVVAPTGIAAINARGTTIHSFFQMPFGPLVPGELAGKNAHKFNKTKIDIFRSLDLLIIDEISMVRADLLDAIDETLKKHRRSKEPFGGVQVLMIGDLQQLAPVVKDEEWMLLKDHYETPFFFSSKALQNSEHTSIELTKVYRQSDPKFINILNQVRENTLSEESMAVLNKRYNPNFQPSEKDGYITLTTHNHRASEINQGKLNILNSKAYSFKAEVDGQFNQYSFPTNEILTLKKGAQVMFVKNDSNVEKRYFNGKIGTIESISQSGIVVKCEQDGQLIHVDKEEWTNIKYNINDSTKVIEEKKVGSFTQYPLKLAWAITIHKSQGLTFEKAIIDANAAFAHGQVYVALSRCKSLEGLVLRTPINNNGIICDSDILSFTKQVNENPPGEEYLKKAKHTYQLNLLKELFDYTQISYKLWSLEKIISDNTNSIHGSIKDIIAQNIDSIQEKIIKVSKNFLLQLDKISDESMEIEQNAKLQERISKAVAYFDENSRDYFHKILNESTFETDNSKIEKSILDLLNYINEQIYIKTECFIACKGGFKLETYLEPRSKAFIQKIKPKKKKTDELTEADVKHHELYLQLKRWRYKLSTKQDIPAYFIAAQKTLIEISNVLPNSTDQLKAISGVGKKKIELYGKDIIDIVCKYRGEKNLGMMDFSDELVSVKQKTKKKTDKADTKNISYTMYKDGKNFSEIATERNLKEETIKGHLASFIASGDININDIVPKETTSKILVYISNNPKAGLKDIRQALGNSISFTDIKMVMALIEYNKKD